jgi:actin-like ATPase involved in cell morphogenesis
MDKQQLLTGQTLNIIINTKTGAKAPTTKGKKMKKEKIDQAKKEVIKILTEDQPKGLNLSKEKIEELASSLVNNYLLKKENA